MSKLESNLQRVYRIEHKVTSFGMYCKVGGKTAVAYKVMRSDDVLHQNPFKDQMLMANLAMHDVKFEECFFCFESISALTQWCYRPVWLQRMHEHGLVLAVYVCEKSSIISGERQAMFYSSVRKRQYSLAKYFDLDALVA